MTQNADQVDLGILVSEMRFSVLGSGSKGNSVYVESGETCILIDAGFSGKQIETRLKEVGRDIHDVNGVLLTHEHNDHVCGAGVISRRLKIPLIGNEGTFQGAGNKLGKGCIRQLFETGERSTFQDLEIRSFPVHHDTLDPVGYVIRDKNITVGYCTDTGKVSHLMAARLAGCDALILEFNHDLQMLKNGPYPLPLQQRVRSSQGHLANEDAADFLNGLLHEKMQFIILAHLSETNNLPQLARKAVEKICSQVSCPLLTAEQDRPTELFDLSVQ